jgi:acetolactate synthase-1/2/3 large subunit/5-guanidino-2-oxopentanoate decarboxylase
MLVISSCLDEVAAKKGQLHQMKDQEAAAACVCDWSETARTAEAAYALVDRAWDEFQSERARPKHIQVPIAQLEAPAAPAPAKAVCSTRPACSPQDLTEVAGLLAKAQKPLFVLGGGARSDALRPLLEHLQAACFTSYAGRGSVGAEYELNFGAALAHPSSADIIASADLVIAIGTELAEVDLWRAGLGHNAPLVRVDIDPVSLSDQHRAQVRILADADGFVRGLLTAVKDRAATTGWQAKDVATMRARWRAETDAARPGIMPICAALRAAVPSDTMIYSDMTQFGYVAKDVWDMDRPGHWHHPYGFGTLGYALPAAIGGALGREMGKLPTMAIVGDYGFHYTMQELGVAVELGLSLPIILWDNGKLKEIEDSMVRGQIAPNAVIARNPDFCKLAEAFGAASAAPNSLSELQETVQAAFAADGPTLILVTPEILG